MNAQHTHTPREHARLLFQAQTLLDCVGVDRVYLPQGKHRKPFCFDVRALASGIDEAGYNASLIMRARVFNVIVRYEPELDRLIKDGFWYEQHVKMQQLKGLFI